MALCQFTPAKDVSLRLAVEPKKSKPHVGGMLEAGRGSGYLCISSRERPCALLGVGAGEQNWWWHAGSLDLRCMCLHALTISFELKHSFKKVFFFFFFFFF